MAGRGSVACKLRIPVSQFRVLRIGTLSEIRPDNMYQPEDNDFLAGHIYSLTKRFNSWIEPSIAEAERFYTNENSPLIDLVTLSYTALAFS